MKNGHAASQTIPFPTRNDLAAEVRTVVNKLLNVQLATLTDLYSQTKHSHWNVKGTHFIGLHKLFDELAEGLEVWIDEVAERITSLGGVAHGTVRMAVGSTQLEDFPIGVHEGMSVVATLSDRYSTSGKHVRSASDTADEHGDADTADLLTDVSKYLDKSLYFLEAHLQDKDQS